MSAILDKIREKHQNGQLWLALNSRYKPYLSSLKYCLYNPAANIKLHCPDYVTPSNDAQEKRIVDRIFNAYKLMREDKQHISKLYQPSSLWQNQLNLSYSYLNDAVVNNDRDLFHYFLANFGTWKHYLGIESGTLIRKNNKFLLGRRYLQNLIFNGQLKTWKWFYNNRKSVSHLSYPTIGNQAGAYVDNHFIGVGSFFNEVCASILAELISDKDRPIIGELGAGYGKFAYFLLREKTNFCYIDFDLPETLCLAAYYLMSIWPNKNVLLYGENEYSYCAHQDYDLIFMPNWEINKVHKKSIDLFININSLGEMTKHAVNNYVQLMTQSTHYFFHVNHDNYPNIYNQNEHGLLGYEYPIPKEFKQLFRYLDVGHMIYHGGINYYMDVFMYLYERKSNTVENAVSR